MNVSTAERLLQYRKQNNLTQEELADKLGVSRQAVSKWERAEAAPDTDNLIALAQLYGVTLDELLGFAPEEGADIGHNEFDGDDDSTSTKKESGTHVTWTLKDGLYVKDDDTEVRINAHGIFVKEGSEWTDTDGNGKKYSVDDLDIDEDIKNTVKTNIENLSNRKKAESLCSSIYGALVLVGFIVWGIVADAWYVSWTLFLTLPIPTSILTCVWTKRLQDFAIYAVASFAYLFIGMMFGMWHPYWVIMLSIPVYYIIASSVDNLTGYKSPSKHDTVIHIGKK